MHLLRMSMMHAALVDSFGIPPRYGEIAQPDPAEGDVLVHVNAAALTNLVRGQANGTHYSSEAVFPAIPGNDGVGTLPDGTRVYFVGPEPGPWPSGAPSTPDVPSPCPTHSMMSLQQHSAIRAWPHGALFSAGHSSSQVKPY
jgi:hypothetical protein